MTIIIDVYSYLRQHGVKRTLRHVRHWISERFHERYYGISTHLFVNPNPSSEGEHYAATTFNAQYCDHEPTPFHAIKKIFSKLPYEHGQDEVLVDYGSGTGRTALVAGMVHPFKAIIGIELVSALVEIAESNRRRVQSKLMCRDVQFSVEDATAYDVPSDATMAFFFNPFSGEILKNVFARIHLSVQASPRIFTIAFVSPYALEPLPWMKQIDTIPAYPYPCHVFQIEPAA